MTDSGVGQVISGEQKYLAYRQKDRLSNPPSGTTESLRVLLNTIREYALPELPANEHGQVPFLRTIFDAALDEVEATIELQKALVGMVRRAKPIIEQDAAMMAALTNHAPYPPEVQARHDSTLSPSEKWMDSYSKFVVENPVVSVDTTELERVKAAVRKHRDAKGHDRCWLLDHDLYRTVLPDEPIPDPQMPMRSEFDQGCQLHWILDQLRRCREYADGQYADMSGRLRDTGTERIGVD